MPGCDPRVDAYLAPLPPGSATGLRASRATRSTSRPSSPPSGDHREQPRRRLAEAAGRLTSLAEDLDALGSGGRREATIKGRNRGFDVEREVDVERVVDGQAVAVRQLDRAEEAMEPSIGGIDSGSEHPLKPRRSFSPAP